MLPQRNAEDRDTVSAPVRLHWVDLTLAALALLPVTGAFVAYSSRLKLDDDTETDFEYLMVIATSSQFMWAMVALLVVIR